MKRHVPSPETIAKMQAARRAQAAQKREAKAKAVKQAPAPEDFAQLVADLEVLEQRKRERVIDFFVPYEKQQAFFDMGAVHRERLLMAGNQVGKTQAGAVETVYHLTGEYPDDWMGKRFDKAVRWWAVGESSLAVRDIQQAKLCGPPGVEAEHGTGFIPKSAFADKPSLARGVTDAYDTIQVYHKSGGISRLTFKSYEQGRTKFQGEPVDGIWCDEEPPMEVYSEILTRITATKGIVYITFTPLKGMSEVVIRYLNEPSPDRGVVTMTIEDAKHIPAEERAKIIAGYPAHERDARAKGIPMLGSGRIFQYSDEAISTTPIDLGAVPPQWFKGWGIDFGIGHPFGAALCAWDKDMDIFYVLACHRVADQKPLEHAVVLKRLGINLPVAWPQDGTAREHGSGEPLASLYKKQGLRMMPDHATHPDGSLSTEAALMEMDTWMSQGRFKVAAHLAQWFEEFRLYHRKDGMIVKLRDDLMSATRVAFMMRRYFRQVALGGEEAKRRRQDVASDVDFDLW